MFLWYGRNLQLANPAHSIKIKKRKQLFFFKKRKIRKQFYHDVNKKNYTFNFISNWSLIVYRQLNTRTPHYSFYIYNPTYFFKFFFPSIPTQIKVAPGYKSITFEFKIQYFFLKTFFYLLKKVFFSYNGFFFSKLKLQKW